MVHVMVNFTVLDYRTRVIEGSGKYFVRNRRLSIILSGDIGN